jgi:hypothetical protein
MTAAEASVEVAGGAAAEVVACDQPLAHATTHAAATTAPQIAFRIIHAPDRANIQTDGQKHTQVYVPAPVIHSRHALFTIWFTPWLLPVLRTGFSACALKLAMFTLTPIPQW